MVPLKVFVRQRPLGDDAHAGWRRLDSGLTPGTPTGRGADCLMLLATQSLGCEPLTYRGPAGFRGGAFGSAGSAALMLSKSVSPIPGCAGKSGKASDGAAGVS